MIYPTVRVVFDRKKEASDTKTGLVQLEVAYRRQRKFISTGVRVYASQWGKDGRVKNCHDMLLLNRRIDEAKASIDKYVLNLAEKEIPFSFGSMTEWMDAADAHTMTFREWVETTITERQDVKPGTKRNHMKIVALLGKMPWIRNFADVNHSNILSISQKLQYRVFHLVAVDNITINAPYM